MPLCFQLFFVVHWAGQRNCFEGNILYRCFQTMRSRAVGSQRSKLRCNYWICAGWVCKMFSGQVVLFRQTAPSSAGDPIRVDSQMPQVRVLVFDFRFYFNLYLFNLYLYDSMRIDTCWAWPRFNVSHMLHILMHTHVRHT